MKENLRIDRSIIMQERKETMEPRETFKYNDYIIQISLCAMTFITNQNKKDPKIGKTL